MDDNDGDDEKQMINSQIMNLDVTHRTIHQTNHIGSKLRFD